MTAISLAFIGVRGGKKRIGTLRNKTESKNPRHIMIGLLAPAVVDASGVVRHHVKPSSTTPDPSCPGGELVVKPSVLQPPNR